MEIKKNRDGLTFPENPAREESSNMLSFITITNMKFNRDDKNPHAMTSRNKADNIGTL